jgi:predicted Fe-Mo cluster-binding NifX family protein
MKIAVAATGRDLDAQVDPRFGRCQGFVVVDSETMEFAAIDNPGGMAGGGAGIQAAQAIARAGAEVVLAGNFGPNAHGALAAGGIKAFLVQGGTVREAVEAFKGGQLGEAAEASVPQHFGMGGRPR